MCLVPGSSQHYDYPAGEHPAVGSRCVVACGDRAQVWGLFGYACAADVAAAHWHPLQLPTGADGRLLWHVHDTVAMLRSSLPEIGGLSMEFFNLFPMKPQCVDVAPAPAGAPNATGLCQGTSTVTWDTPTGASTPALPVTSLQDMVNMHWWLESSLYDTPALQHVAAAVSADGTGAASENVAALNPADDDGMSAAGRLLGMQWSVISAAAANGTSGFLLLYQPMNGGQHTARQQLHVVAQVGHVAPALASLFPGIELAPTATSALSPSTQQSVQVELPTETSLRLVLIASGSVTASTLVAAAEVLTLSTQSCGGIQLLLPEAASTETGPTTGALLPLHIPGSQQVPAVETPSSRQLQGGAVASGFTAANLGLSLPYLQQPATPTKAEPLVISPVYTPAGVQVQLFMPSQLGPYEQLQIDCSVSRDQTLASRPASISVTPAAWTLLGAALAPVTSTTPATGNLTHELTLLPLWQTAGDMVAAQPWGGLHVLGCQVTSSLHASAPAGAPTRYRASTNIALPVLHATAVLPVFGDAAMQAFTGGWMSAWLRQTPSQATTRSMRAPKDTVPYGPAVSLDTAGMSVALIQAHQAVSPATPAELPPLPAYASVSQRLASSSRAFSADSVPFTLTVTGSQQVVLSAAGSPGVTTRPLHANAKSPLSGGTGAVQAFAFAPGMRVWVGSVEAQVNGVSCDGLLARVALPPFEALCQDRAGAPPQLTPQSAPCAGAAYRALHVINPPLIPPLFLDSLQSLALSSGAGAGALNCSWLTPDHPAFAQGQASWRRDNASVGVVLTPAIVLNSVLGGAMSCPAACPGRNQPPGADTPSNTYGVYVTGRCVGYPEPGPQCFTESLRSVCAFGQGGACSPCGSGAVCPGGFRRWPLPGYWAPSEAAATGVVRCNVPAQERCIGWDASLGVAQCGEGYDAAAPACGACTAGYFPEVSGQCAQCPSGPGHTNMLFALALLLAACTVLFLVVAAAIRLLAWMKGGTMGGGLYRASEFVVWTITTLQVFVQVGRDASPGLPSFLQSFYGHLRLLQLDSASLLHPACYALGAFTMDILQLGGALLLVAVSVALSFWRRTEATRNNDAAQQAGPATCAFWLWAFAQAKPWMRRAALVLMSLLYPLVANTAFKLVNCVQTAAAKSGADGATLQLRLASSTFYVCYAEEHFTAGVLAWLCIAFFVIGFPVASFVWLRRRLDARMRRSPAAAKYKALVLSLKRQQALVRERRCNAACGCLSAAVCCSKRPKTARSQSQDVRNPLAAAGAPSSHRTTGQLDSDEEEWLAEQAVAAAAAPAAPRGTNALDILRTHRSTSRVWELSQSNKTNGLTAGLRVPANASSPRGAAQHSPTDQHNPLAARTQRQSVLMRVDQKLRSRSSSAPRAINASATHRTPRRSLAASAARGAAQSRRWCDTVVAPAVRHTLCVAPRRLLSAAWRNGLKRAGCRCRAVDSANQAAQRTGQCLDQLLDSTQALQEDVSLIHFTAIDYRPSKAHFRHMDLLLLGVMAAVFVFLSSQNTVADATGSMVIILLCLFGLAGAVYAQQPFLEGHEWKGPVRIGALLVTALASILNYIAACAFDLEGCNAPPDAVQGLSILVAFCAALLFLVLVFSFWLVLLRGAEAAGGRRKPKKGLVADVTYATGGNPLVQVGSSARAALPSLASALHGSGGKDAKAGPTSARRMKGLAAMQLTMQPSQRRLATGAVDRSKGSAQSSASRPAERPEAPQAEGTPSKFAAATLGHFKGNVDGAKRGRIQRN